MAFSVDDISINTIIGSGSAVSGDIRVSGFVRVDGDIDGNLETTGRIIIGEKARIRGNVTAKSVSIGGIVQGDVHAPESVRLFSTSMVIGDIVTRKIEVAENVIFHGHCISLNEMQEYEAARADRQTIKTVTARSELT